LREVGGRVEASTSETMGEVHDLDCMDPLCDRTILRNRGCHQDTTVTVSSSWGPPRPPVRERRRQQQRRVLALLGCWSVWDQRWSTAESVSHGSSEGSMIIILRPWVRSTVDYCFEALNKGDGQASSRPCCRAAVHDRRTSMVPLHVLSSAAPHTAIITWFFAQSFPGLVLRP